MMTNIAPTGASALMSIHFIYPTSFVRQLRLPLLTSTAEIYSPLAYISNTVTPTHTHAHTTRTHNTRTHNTHTHNTKSSQTIKIKLHYTTTPCWINLYPTLPLKGTNISSIHTLTHTYIRVHTTHTHIRTHTHAHAPTHTSARARGCALVALCYTIMT